MPSGPTKGTVPPGPGGPQDLSKVPDYVAAVDAHHPGAGTVGYVSKTDIFGAPGVQAARDTGTPMTVYGADLKTVVGHMYPNKGFVPVGTDPNSVPDVTHPIVGASSPPGAGPITPQIGPPPLVTP
jgi:hypothetical protein